MSISLGFLLTLMLVSFIFTLSWGPLVIRWIKSHQVQQPIRNDGPQTHASKVGTPTMGGLIFLFPVLILSIIFGWRSSIGLAPLAVVFIFALIGFADDWSKIKKKSHKGLSGKLRLLLETLVSATFCWVLTQQGDYQTALYIPFCTEPFIMPPLAYIIFSTVVIVGTANAVNLTDGLDGLAIIPVSLVAGFMALVCLLMPESLYTSSSLIILLSCIGAGVGFLWYNTHPARIFMGDLGSLSLGGVLGAVAVILNLQLYLLIAGALFVIEALSVII